MATDGLPLLQLTQVGAAVPFFYLEGQTDGSGWTPTGTSSHPVDVARLQTHSPATIALHTKTPALKRVADR